MRLTLIIVLAVIVAIIIYIAIHHEITKHATLIVRKSAQGITDDAMRTCLQVLADQKLLHDSEVTFSQSQTVADVWGRGVMAFEYTLLAQDIDTDQLGIVTKTLNERLSKYDQDNNIEQVSNADNAFIVTDAWLFESKLHLDIAYLMNVATYEYVRDLKRID
ncbi:membrane protein [Paucilactobacillus hokkaidonensis JCM 18461]|uniref:Membrane protein n=2 Tax=Paucilactobacillus hokkaidonensis TaxID=1193095 RepID=A0A0A1GV55_9LACO|nr:hypothetical protein [Paucilactobacillus hokkaidonensis]KRO09904.1 hypothetical protein IV59_GL000211 [Paucilactobacillus hokkaidonensis]BAP85885.1 membrane protein [Paucilactobacillus hokkaidonensis JCM 18461]